MYVCVCARAYIYGGGEGGGGRSDAAGGGGGNGGDDTYIHTPIYIYVYI